MNRIQFIICPVLLNEKNCKGRLALHSVYEENKGICCFCFVFSNNGKDYLQCYNDMAVPAFTISNSDAMQCRVFTDWFR